MASVSCAVEADPVHVRRRDMGATLNRGVDADVGFRATKEELLPASHLVLHHCAANILSSSATIPVVV